MSSTEKIVTPIKVITGGGLAQAEAVARVVKRLRGRALRYGRYAVGIMVLIVLVLIGGVTLFVLAPVYSGIVIVKGASVVESRNDTTNASSTVAVSPRPATTNAP
jgi:hypothetical protein